MSNGGLDTIQYNPFIPFSKSMNIPESADVSLSAYLSVLPPRDWRDWIFVCFFLEKSGRMSYGDKYLE
jgi:hypothetical protein